MRKEDLEIIPNQQQLSSPLFPDARVYEEFRQSFREQISPILEDLAFRRAQSEYYSRLHLVY